MARRRGGDARPLRSGVALPPRGGSRRPWLLKAAAAVVVAAMAYGGSVWTRRALAATRRRSRSGLLQVAGPLGVDHLRNHGGQPRVLAQLRIRGHDLLGPPPRLR